MRLGNRKCAGDSGPMSLVANASSRTASQAGVASAAGSVGGIDGDARRQFDRQRLVRLFDLDPGQAVAEKILSFAPVHGFGQDLQRRDMHPLAGARNRRQAQDVTRMRHRRGVGAVVVWRTS